MKLQVNLLRDVLHNLSPEAGSDSEYARGVLVGTVTALCACGYSFDEALELCSTNAPRTILPNSVPPTWCFGVYVHGTDTWTRQTGLIRRHELLEKAAEIKREPWEVLARFDIPHDRYNNGGMAEVIDLILAGGDDPEWVLEELDSMRPRFTLEWWYDTEEDRIVEKDETLPHTTTVDDVYRILREHWDKGELVRVWDEEDEEYIYL